jgi:hypothetical protein
MNKFRLLTLAAIFIVAITAKAQSDLMLYNFKGVGQSSLINPAIRSDQRFTFSFLSNEFAAHNTGFTMHELMARGTELDDNIGKILNQIDERDFIRMNNETHLLFTSFHLGKSSSLSFGTKTSTLNSLTLPVNILWLTRGNDQERFRNQEVQLGDWTMDFSVLFSWHIGFQQTINERLSLGARFYRHYGIANFNLSNDANDISVYFGDEEWRLNSNAFLRTSTILGPIDKPGLSQFDMNNLDLSANKGYSFDFGAEYKLTDQFTLSASLNGLGSILYDTGLRNIRVSGIVEYDGIEIDIRDGNPRSGDALDAILETFQLDTIDGSAYRRNLPTQVIVAGEYRLSDRHAFSSINRFMAWNGRNYYDFNLRYVWTPTRFFHGLVNISTIEGRVWGGGLGMQTYFPGFQFFIMADIMSNSLYVEDFKGAFVNVGFNFALWDKSKYKKTTTQETATAP